MPRNVTSQLPCLSASTAFVGVGSAIKETSMPSCAASARANSMAMTPVPTPRSAPDAGSLTYCGRNNARRILPDCTRSATRGSAGRIVATLCAVALSFARLGEEFLAIGKTIRLEEEAEQHGAVGRHRLVLIAGRPPDELARPAFAFVIFERALDHVGLLQRSVLVQRHDGAGRELEQRGGDAVAVGIEHLDLDAGKFGLLPRQVRRIDIVRGALRRIVGLDVGMHDFAGWRGHGCLLLYRASVAASILRRLERRQGVCGPQKCQGPHV